MKILENIHQVDGVVGNSYIIIEENGLILVDTGMPKSQKKILNYINSIDHKPEDVKQIVLTHAHIDHVGSALKLKQLTNAKIMIHEEDAPYVTGEKQFNVNRGLLMRMFSSFMKFETFSPDIKIKENDKISDFLVIHVPGHTPGSIALYNEKNRVMFVGDLLRFMNGNVQGPPEQFTLDMNLAKKSIEKILNYDFQIMLSGHGDPLKENAREKVKEFYEKFR